MKSLKSLLSSLCFFYLQLNKPKLLNTRKSRRRSRNHAMCSWCVNMDFIHAQRFKCKMEVSCRENLSLFQLTCMDDLWRKSTNSFMKRWVLLAMHVSLIHSSHVHFLFISFYIVDSDIFIHLLLLLFLLPHRPTQHIFFIHVTSISSFIDIFLSHIFSSSSSNSFPFLFVRLICRRLRSKQ